MDGWMGGWMDGWDDHAARCEMWDAEGENSHEPQNHRTTVWGEQGVICKTRSLHLCTN